MKLYNNPKAMPLTISQARQTLFALVEAADRGEKVEFTHKGRKFFIVAESQPSKLARLQPLPILPPNTTLDQLDQALKDLTTQLSAAWEQNNS